MPFIVAKKWQTNGNHNLNYAMGIFVLDGVEYVTPPPPAEVQLCFSIHLCVTVSVNMLNFHHSEIFISSVLINKSWDGNHWDVKHLCDYYGAIFVFIVYCLKYVCTVQVCCAVSEVCCIFIYKLQQRRLKGPLPI